MQAQQFDVEKKYSTFQEMLTNIPNADSMHYLVSTAAIGYIRQLNGKVPEVWNQAGKLCVPFKNFRFEILQSHILDKNKHRVAIFFYSEELIWIDSVDKHLIFAPADKFEMLSKGKDIDTETLILPPNLSICSFRRPSPINQMANEP